MANHQIPRRARLMERIYGVTDDGEVAVLAVYHHTRAGHAEPMFYVLQYAYRGRAIDRATRVTREFTGPRAMVRLAHELVPARAMLAESRVRAAEGGPR